ncbi:MAG: hypothetical protein C0600_04440 [Ignavibacteria bacterium]|nr:MAG: hypothetical protein C0600_04440 [Ignavibacteria bacterium]
MDEGRKLFASSVDDEEDLETARQVFTRIRKEDASLRGRAMVYLGALDIVAAKHTFWPHNKSSLVKRGLKKMEKGLRVAPKDIEARFIHGAICYQLPFFFGCGDDVERDFALITSLLNTPSQPCDTVILRDMQDFIDEEDVLTESERNRIRKLIVKRRAEFGRESK